jgi:hypothetical protein
VSGKLPRKFANKIKGLTSKPLILFDINTFRRDIINSGITKNIDRRKEK